MGALSDHSADQAKPILVFADEDGRMVAVGCADDDVFQVRWGAAASCGRPTGRVMVRPVLRIDSFGMASDLIRAENMTQQDIQADGGEIAAKMQKAASFQPEFSGMQQTNHDRGTE